MYRVINLPRADRDVTDIFEYIRSMSARGAEAWLNAYRKALTLLIEFADGCPVADESHYFDFELRQSSFQTRHGKRYRLVFTLAGDEVRILRVRGPGQSDLDSSDD